MPTDNLSANRMEFTAEAIPLFIKSLLTGLSALIYVPAPGQLTGLMKYSFSHLRFSDGSTAEYVGTEEPLKQPMIGVTAMIWAQILLRYTFSSPILGLLVSVAASLGMAYFVYQVIQVVVANVKTSHGSRLNFAASLEDYLKWQLIIVAVSVIPGVLTIVLPLGVIMGALFSIVMMFVSLALYGVVFTMYYRWLASKIQGGSRIASFNAEPLQYVLRMVGLGLFCVLIVTIPWAVLWFVKWQATQVSLPARVPVAGYAV